LVLAVGGLKERAFRELCDEYYGRIRRVAKLDEIEVKNDASLERAIPRDTRLVACEVKGKALTSEGFSQRIEQWTSQGKGHVTFLIGGAEGIPEAVSNRADFKISLSTMTLPHRLARVVLSEQIYRALSILRGEPYARED
jgi:23S rRNA (pseudouridine1915-N3)-methyltransferase